MSDIRATDRFRACVCYARACWRVTRRMLWMRSGQLYTTVDLVLSVYVVLTLKAVSPIDWHYMTDRLQRFELKNLCVLLKKQSHLHLGCPGGKQINITFSFLGVKMWCLSAYPQLIPLRILDILAGNETKKKSKKSIFCSVVPSEKDLY